MPSYKELLEVRDGYYCFPKYAAIKLSPHFTTDEFACKCHNIDCNEQRVSCELIDKLEELRLAIKVPIHIHSGFRCSKHQAELRGQGLKTASGTSTHERGEAADISCRDLKQIEKLFKAVGVARTFTHVDLRADKTRRWSY